METRDWIDLAIAIGTGLLALATFVLAVYTRRTAGEASIALGVYRSQAESGRKQAELAAAALEEQRLAGKRQFDIASTALEEQRRQARVQARSHVIWLDSTTEADISDDPRTWGTGAPSGTTLRLDVEVANLSPVGAYLDRVEGDSMLAQGIINTPFVEGRGRGKVTLYVPAEIGKPIETYAHPLVLVYQSTITGEEGRSQALLHVYGVIEPTPSGLITGRTHMFAGNVSVTTVGSAPTPDSRTV